MNRRPVAQVLLGLLITAVGVVALLSKLGVTDLSIRAIAGTYWPLTIVVVGVSALVTVPRAWVGPVGVILVGGFLQLRELDVVEFAFWDLFWPAVLIVVGISLLTRTSGRDSDARSITSAVVWWGSERRSSSQDFRSASLSALMGGIELDLREAGIVDHAEISIFSMWGGVEVKVPPTWRVEVSGLPLLGGWENKTAAPQNPEAPVLVVHVTAIMGGAEIKN